MNSKLKWVLNLVVLLALGLSVIPAQSGVLAPSAVYSISGQVKDSGGAALPGVQIVARTGVTLSVDPGSVPADGSTPATVTLYGSVPNHSVLFKSSRGTIDSFTQASGTTDANGQFSTQVKSAAAGQAVITAQDLTSQQMLDTSTTLTFSGSGTLPPAKGGEIGITGVTSKYALDGRYLQYVPVPANPVQVTVDWKGYVPGRVDFTLNGRTFSEPASSAGATHVFSNFGTDLQSGQNTLRIIAYTTTGQATLPKDYRPFSMPLPVWLAGLVRQGAFGPIGMGGSRTANFEYQAVVKLPPQGINVDAFGFGPPGSTNNVNFFVGGGFSLPLTCSSPVKVKATAGGEYKVKNFNLLHINVIQPNAGAVTVLPAALAHNTYWTAKDITNQRTLAITDTGPGTPFTFDNAGYAMDTINQTVKLNAIEQWSITNGKIFDHSFHIHDVQFNIISRSSGPVPEYEKGWKDTFYIRINETVVFLARFDDYASADHPYMYHCHMANHEDAGLMGQFLVK